MDLAILVHGLFTSQLDVSPLDALVERLEEKNFEVHHFKYGFLTINQAFRNRTIADRLVSLVNSTLDRYDRILLISHSNGCSITHLALNSIESFRRVEVIFLAASVQPNICIPDCVSRLQVFYNPFDIILMLLRPLCIFKKFIGSRNWGCMGLLGYIGSDTRIKNHLSLTFSMNVYDQHNSSLLDFDNFSYLLEQV